MLTATVAKDEAARRVWDVVVVGAGPAGALAARELARFGLTALLVDGAAFPRGKVCGCCFNGRALSVLNAVGLGTLTRRLGAVPLTTFCLAAGGRRVLIGLPCGAALSRDAFDAALIAEAVRAGARFLPLTRAVDGPCTGATRSIILRDRAGASQVEARLVVAATGLSDTFFPQCRAAAAASRIGAAICVADAPPSYQEGSIYMACGHSGYVGLVRLEDGRLEVAAALDAAAVRQCGGLSAVVTATLDQAGLPAVPGLAAAGWHGTPLSHRRAPRQGVHRLFVIGDAAGCVEPLTGEGISWALTSALTVVPFAVQAVHRWQPQLAVRWERTYRRAVGRRQLIGRALAGIARCPNWTNCIVRLLAVAPGLSAPLVRRVTQPATAFSGMGP